MRIRHGDCDFENRDQLLRTRIGARVFGIGDAVDRFPTTEPPRDVTPQRPNLASTFRMHRFGRALVRAYEYCPLDSPERCDARCFEYRLHAGEFPGSVTRLGGSGQVMQCKHRMGLAAAKIGLQSDHRIAAFSGQTRECRRQDAPQTFGCVGDTKKGGRVNVFFTALALIYKSQVRSELSIGKSRFEHVRVGFADFAPGTQLRPRRGLIEIQFDRLALGDCAIGRALLIIK